MDWSKPANEESVGKAAAALKANGFNVVIVNDRRAALEEATKLVPEGAEVMTAGSTTLSEIGFTDLLKSGNHRWMNLKEEIVKEKDPQKQHELRLRSVSAPFMLGSVHAITENGELLTASASGSQLPGYAFSSHNLVLVVGTQKIVKSMDDAMQRIKEYSVPLEDKRMKAAGMGGTMYAKLLILFKEPAFMQRKVTVILVKEKLGF